MSGTISVTPKFLNLELQSFVIVPPYPPRHTSIISQHGCSASALLFLKIFTYLTVLGLSCYHVGSSSLTRD